MQLSSRLIKGNIAKNAEKKVIDTEYTPHNIDNHIEDNSEKTENTIEYMEKENVIDPEEMIKEYQVVADRIVEDARKEKEKILSETYENAENIEKEAYEKGYNQGEKNGYDDGLKKVYAENIEKAKKEASEIVKKAENMLKSAEDQYGEYLKEKKKDVVDLALTIASTIVRQKLTTDDGMNNLVEEAFKLSKGEESIVIKVNKIHIQKLKENIDKWKVTYDIKNEIFILEDTFLEPGNAVIEKTSGIIKVGIESGLSEIKKALIG